MNTLPTLQPNDGIIQNPVVRKWAGNIIAIATLVLLIVILFDNSIPAFDIKWLTEPATQIVVGLFAIFQLGVTSQNIGTTELKPLPTTPGAPREFVAEAAA